MTNLNDKLRFIVLTLLMMGVLPIMLVVIFIGWLSGTLDDMTWDYVDFFNRTWRSN